MLWLSDTLRKTVMIYPFNWMSGGINYTAKCICCIHLFGLKILRPSIFDEIENFLPTSSSIPGPHQSSLIETGKASITKK